MWLLIHAGDKVKVKKGTLECLQQDPLTPMTWWRHQMETFSALLAICAGNSPVPGEFPAQRPVTRRFDVFFDLCLKKQLSKQSWGWWFETLSRRLWRHFNDILGSRPLHFDELVECFIIISLRAETSVCDVIQNSLVEPYLYSYHFLISLNLNQFSIFDIIWSIEYLIECLVWKMMTLWTTTCNTTYHYKVLDDMTYPFPNVNGAPLSVPKRQRRTRSSFGMDKKLYPTFY